MSQFCGYTVDLVLKEPTGKTIRGIIGKIVEKDILLTNPVVIKQDGSYEKINKKELIVDASLILDLNVIELAKSSKTSNGKKINNNNGSNCSSSSSSSSGNNNNNINGNNNSTNGNQKQHKKQNKKEKNKEKLKDDAEKEKDRKDNKDIEVKYVDIYNEKPSSKQKNNKKVKDLEEFDFASNLQKFDKESVFKDISLHDKVDQSARLVSFNKIDGNKEKYGNDEMVLKKKHDDSWDNNDNYDYSNIVNKHQSEIQSVNSSENILQSRQASNTSYERKVSLTPTFAQFSNSLYDDSNIPTCSTLQLSDIFNICKDKFGLTEQIMNENAGRSISELIINNIIGDFRITFKNHNETPVVLLLIGNNKAGATALTAGRHLFNCGLKTIAYLLYDKENSEDELLAQVDNELKRYSNVGGKIVNGLKQLDDILNNMGLPLEFILEGLQGFDCDLNDLVESELEQAIELIEWCNSKGLPMMSIDIPSGLNPSSGTNENDILLLKSKYLVSVGLPLTSALNMYKFGYFEKGKMIHHLIDCGVPRRVFSTKSSLRKFDRRWFADTSSIELDVL